MTTPTKAATANDLGEKCQIIIGNVGYTFAPKQIGDTVFKIRPQLNRIHEGIYVSTQDHLTMRDAEDSRIFMNDWRSGQGQIAYLSDDPISKSRFWDSVGIDIHDAGRFTMVHDIVANANGTSVNTTALPVHPAGAYLYMGDLSAVKFSSAWGGAPTSAATSAAGNVVALADDGQYVYGAVSGVGINRWTIGSAAAGTNWSTPSTTIRSLAWANRLIYAVDAGNFYSIIPAGTATTQFTPPSGWTFQDVTAKRGGAIDAPVILLATAGNRSATWYWDGAGIHDYVALPTGFVGMRLIAYLGLIFIYGYRLNPDSSASPCAYYIQNDNLGFLGYFGNLQSNGNPTANGVTSAANYDVDAYDNFVYFAVSTNNQEVWRYDIANGGITRYHRTLTGTANTITGLAIYQNGPWVSILGSGLYNTTQTYVTTATLDTSDLNLGQPWATNLWVTLEIVHSSIAAGEGIKVDYSVDQGATYTTILTETTIGTTRSSQTMSSSSSSVKSPYIRLRFTLTSGTGQATAPYLFSFALKAEPLDPGGIAIEADLACPDQMTMPNMEPDWQGMSGAERIQNIIDLFNNQSIVNVIYMGTNSARAKNPITMSMNIVDYEVQEHSSVGYGPNRGIEGNVHVTLRQVV